MRLFGRAVWVKMLRNCLVVFLVSFLVHRALTALLSTAKEDELATLRRQEGFLRKPSLDSFTLIMQTFNRTDILLRLLNHYQAVPCLQKVIIVWNNVGEKPPEGLWHSLGPQRIPVMFQEQAVNRLTNRLQPFQGLETDAVLMIDDNIVVSAHDLAFAFSVWQQFPDQIIGFDPRKHIPTPSGIYSYGSYELQSPESGRGDLYSMILIGAAFFHRRYLESFPKQPKAVHTLINETQNCDDIAMNFIVANHTGKPSGVFVKPVDISNSGMSHRAEYLLQRSYCLNKLVTIYGSMPLKYSNIMISQIGFPNYANHKTKM